MQLNVPPDVEALAQKRLDTGAYADAEENWTDAERHALDGKIDDALEQAGASRVSGPDAARRKLASLKEAHLANRT